jgi:type I restriction enzyme S subunit
MSELPADWQLISLHQLGRWVGGGTPSKSNPSFWVKDGLPWVSPKDMKRLLIDDAEDHISEAAVRASTTNVIPKDSILVVTRSGILSHSLPVAKAARSVAINQDMKALIPQRPLRGRD